MLFLLGEFQDREFFPKIIELALLPPEVLDYLIGDMITSGLKDVLYNTYNGDIELLKNAIMDEMSHGKYDSCVDYMFTYRDYEKKFCESPMNTADTLRHWAMFEENPKKGEKESREDFEKLIKIDTIESTAERKKCLESYPYTGGERKEGRIYLENYFDSESIEIDKMLYLGLMNRPRINLAER